MRRDTFFVVGLSLAALMVNGLACGQPVRIIQHDIACAAPFFANVDGDGRKDLLVEPAKPVSRHRKRSVTKRGSPQTSMIHDSVGTGLAGW